MDNNEFESALIKADRIIRPKAIICNPKNAEVIKANFEKTHKIIVSNIVDPDKVYVVDRKSFDIEAIEEV